MVAFTPSDNRDTKIIEIEFEKHVRLANILSFINAVNNGNVPFLGGGAADGVQAGFAFDGATDLADVLEPRRDRFVAVRVPNDRSSQAVATQLKASNGDIARAASRPMFIPATTPSDEYIGKDDQRPPGSPKSQWYLYRCKVPPAWAQSLGADVIVADIDWGFRLTHDDLTGRYDSAGIWNILDKSTNVSQGDLSHGTGAAGMIGAAANTKGIAGVAPECTLWLLQAGIVGESGPEPPSTLVNSWASAIDWVVTKQEARRKVINVEIQSGMKYSAETSVAIQGAVRRAISANVFVCIPAGNGCRSTDIGEDHLPIPDTGSIVVGATGYDSSINPKAGYSNHGKRVRLAAPGESGLDLTCGAASDTEYTEAYGGTSGASAKVAGALALLLSLDKDLTHADLLTAIDGLTPNVDGPYEIGKFLDCAALATSVVAMKTKREEALAKYAETPPSP